MSHGAYRYLYFNRRQVPILVLYGYRPVLSLAGWLLARKPGLSGMDVTLFHVQLIIHVDPNSSSFHKMELEIVYFTTDRGVVNN